MNYRKYYEEYFKVKVPKDFDVHHIDGNRNNNDILNLVALPKGVHQRYHYALNQFNITISKHDLELTSHNCNYALGYSFNVIDNMKNSLSECFYYIVYRDILLEILPSHMLTIEKPY